MSFVVYSTTPTCPACPLGNGEISKDEFSDGFKSHFGGTVEQANKMFGMLDKDNSGDISMDEIKDLFKEMDKDSKSVW